jgi:hypothetical protein
MRHVGDLAELFLKGLAHLTQFPVIGRHRFLGGLCLQNQGLSPMWIFLLRNAFREFLHPPPEVIGFELKIPSLAIQSDHPINIRLDMTMTAIGLHEVRILSDVFDVEHDVRVFLFLFFRHLPSGSMILWTTPSVEK